MTAYSYQLVYRGQAEAEGVNTDHEYATVAEFGAAYARILDDGDGPPLPYPLELRVWAGDDTGRNPDFVHTRIRRRQRALSGAAAS